MTQKEFCRRSHLFYGESFPLYVADAKPKPPAKPAKKISDDTNKKLEHLLLLLTQLLEGEQKAQDKAKQRRFQKICTEAERGYGDRNPHTRRDQNRLSLRVENDQKPLNVRDRAISGYVIACAESAAAYAARNPHSKRG